MELNHDNLFTCYASRRVELNLGPYDRVALLVNGSLLGYLPTLQMALHISAVSHSVPPLCRWHIGPAGERAGVDLCAVCRQAGIKKCDQQVATSRKRSASLV